MARLFTREALAHVTIMACVMATLLVAFGAATGVWSPIYVVGPLHYVVGFWLGRFGRE